MDVEGLGYNPNLTVARESKAFFYGKDKKHVFYRHMWFAAAGIPEPDRAHTPTVIRTLCAMKARIKDRR